MVNKSFKEFIKENRELKKEEIIEDTNDVVDNNDKSSEEDIHTKWINFLKDEVSKYCNENGCYEIYWDYRDELEPAQVQEYVDKAINNNESLELIVSDELLDNNLDYEDNLFNSIQEDVPEELKEYESTREDDGVWVDDLYEAGYNGLDANAKDLLDRTNLRINVLYSTSAEQNLDHTSIVKCFGSWQSPDYENMTTEDLDNGMTYTINQQGHSIKEYYDCLLQNPGGFGFDHKSTFIESCVDDCVNNSSDAMSVMCVLTNLSAEEYYKLRQAQASNEGNITFSANSYCGTVNPWSGAGGLSVELEKPLSIPVADIYEVQVEGGDNTNYTVDEIFGLTGECWKGTMTFEGETATLENLDEALQYIKSIAPKDDEEE